jgi:hypothetical protein
MAHKIISFAFLFITLGFFGCTSERYTQNTKDHVMQRDTLRRMSEQDVINLSKAGMSDSLVIGMMDATDTWFQLKAQDVIDLKNAGVSEKVITAMMQQPTPSTSQASTSPAARYYVYPPYYWYDGYFSYGYYPRVAVRIGGFHTFHHRRFR